VADQLGGGPCRLRTGHRPVAAASARSAAAHRRGRGRRGRAAATVTAADRVRVTVDAAPPGDPATWGRRSWAGVTV
jgi:hypothetical protein